jgi:hypothetical protein
MGSMFETGDQPIYSIGYNTQCWLVAWLLGDHFLFLRDFGPYVKIFMNVCVITVAMVW